MLNDVGVSDVEVGEAGRGLEPLQLGLMCCA